MSPTYLVNPKQLTALGRLVGSCFVVKRLSDFSGKRESVLGLGEVFTSSLALEGPIVGAAFANAVFACRTTVGNQVTASLNPTSERTDFPGNN